MEQVLELSAHWKTLAGRRQARQRPRQRCRDMAPKFSEIPPLFKVDRRTVLAFEPKDGKIIVNYAGLGPQGPRGPHPRASEGRQGILKVKSQEPRLLQFSPRLAPATP